MTQDEIIRMAREAGFSKRDAMGRPAFLGNSYDLERFAALVASHEREKWEQALPIAMDAMMLQEREACAKVCEELGEANRDAFAKYDCAAAIRARNDK